MVREIPKNADNECYLQQYATLIDCLNVPITAGEPIANLPSTELYGLDTRSLTYYYDPIIDVWNRQKEISTEETLTAFKDLVDSVIYLHDDTEIVANGVMVMGRETDGTPQAIKVDSEGAVHLASEVTLHSSNLNVDVAAFQKYDHSQEDAYVFADGDELTTIDPGSTDVMYQVIAGRYYNETTDKPYAKPIPISVDGEEMEATPPILPIGGEYRSARTQYSDGDAVIPHFNDYGDLNTNTVELGGEPIDLGTGTIGTGTQRVTIATDDPVTLLLQQMTELPAGYTLAGETTETFDCRTGQLGAFTAATPKQLTLSQGSNQMIKRIEIIPATPPVATGLTFEVWRGDGTLPVGVSYSGESSFHEFTKDFTNNPYDADVWLEFSANFEAVIQITYMYEA